MTDRPILFSGPMVRAILDGRKVQTRRIIKDAPTSGFWHCDMRDGKPWFVAEPGAPSMPANVSYAVGDRLWVRETWADDVFVGNRQKLIFRADGDDEEWQVRKWRPSIFMPRWASRITCLVIDVRVQRVQDISLCDSTAEGIREFCPDPDEPYRNYYHWLDGVGEDDGFLTPRLAFEELWHSINAKRGYGWDVNPWVVAITFDPVFENIDRMAKECA